MISCNVSKKSEGTWISSYSINSNEEELFPISEKNILEFENDFIRVIQVGGLSKYSYKRSAIFDVNEIILNDSLILDINEISKDSLILNDFSGNKLIYKKMHDSLKNKSNEEINLNNKKFTIHYPKFTDTIFFVNDSILKSSNYGDLERYWGRIKYKGYDLILINDILDFPIIITDINKTNIDAKILFRETIPLKLKKLDKME